MAETFDHAIVQFLTANGNRAVGTGFVISPRHILTCTHVLASVLGVDNRIPLAVGTTVVASLPLNPVLSTLTCKVLRSYPCVDLPDLNTIEDISILEVSDAVVLSYPALKVLPDSGHHHHSFRTYGFNRQNGSWFRGYCAGVVAEGWIQLQVDNAGDENLNGLSGAPVWDEQENAVTGMLVAKQRGNLKSYMIPVSRLLRAGAELLLTSVAIKPVVLTAFQQQKLKALEERRSRLHELLTRQQEELTFADDPKRQMRLERDINVATVSLEQVEAELTSLSPIPIPCNIPV